MDKFTWCVDGDWWMRAKGSKATPAGYPTFTTNIAADKVALWRKLTLDLCHEIDQLQHVINNIVFVTDTKSWRKSHKYLLPPWTTETEGTELYKAGRTYDETIDWDAMKQAFYEWLAALSKFGVKHFRADGAEGDDWIWYLSDKHKALGKNFLYTSADKDLIQCMGFGVNNAVSLYYHRKNGNKQNNFRTTRALFVDKAIESYIDQQLFAEGSDIFSISSVNAAVMSSLLNTVQLRLNEHVPSFLFYRIVLGDLGDGIPHLMVKPTGKPKYPQIGTIYDVLTNDFGINDSTNCLTYDMLYNDEFILHFVKVFHNKHMKCEASEVELDYYVKRFKENRLLGTINDKEIPEYVINRMSNVFNLQYNESSDIHGITIQSMSDALIVPDMNVKTETTYFDVFASINPETNE